ncbi:MAG: cell division protein ZapA [SAR324 cluster bacterium]|nr:cell division protein ZapA [SAR324 cluster bacterium]
MVESSQNNLKQYKINIKGHQFSVSSQYTEEQIREVEAFLIERIDEIAAKSDTYNLMSLTVLVALNLADDLLSIRNNKDYMADAARESLMSICNRLDSVMEKEKISSTS